jgi:hypothetical protein
MQKKTVAQAKRDWYYGKLSLTIKPEDEVYTEDSKEEAWLV